MLNPVDVMDIQKTALWFAKNTGIVLNCVAFSWRVDNTEHFFQMILNELKAHQYKISVCGVWQMDEPDNIKPHSAPSYSP
jgi:hypothetical protein